VHWLVAVGLLAAAPGSHTDESSRHGGRWTKNVLNVKDDNAVNNFFDVGNSGGVIKEMDEKLDARLELKLKTSTLDVLKQIELRHRLSPQETLRSLADAAADFFKKYGWFSFPVTVSPEKFQNQEMPMPQGRPVPAEMPASNTKPELGMPRYTQENMSAKIAAHRLEAARVTGRTYLPHERSKLTSAKGLALPKRFKRGQRRPESVTDKF
jgi:hypothetical protein